jgi:hypothetical protein
VIIVFYCPVEGITRESGRGCRNHLKEKRRGYMKKKRKTRRKNEGRNKDERKNQILEETKK